MDTHPSPPRPELDLLTEQDLARQLKICRRQLHNWRVAGQDGPTLLGVANSCHPQSSMQRENNKLTVEPNRIRRDISERMKPGMGSFVPAFG